MTPITRTISVFPPIVRSAVLVTKMITIENSYHEKHKEFYIPFRYAALPSPDDRATRKSGVFLRPYRLQLIRSRTNPHSRSAVEMKRRRHQPVENIRYE
ncbi:hypothetical protein [Neorhizobium sp. T7_12]|uniref:hypothetical protein n=1 Tax=Neorhizobium sp. T7_12 TaxID=2093832 RepID=UPI00155F28BE|nr:hypothetical protein [Neorhizobium sp. T7_12]